MHPRQKAEAFHRAHIAGDAAAHHRFLREAGLQRGRVASLQRELAALRASGATAAQLAAVAAEITARDALAARLVRLGESAAPPHTRPTTPDA